MQALNTFALKTGGKLPAPWSAEDAAVILTLAEEANSKMKNKVDKLDETLLKQLSYTAQGGIVPMTAFMGGMIGQECLKALSGKYTPLNQWVK